MEQNIGIKIQVDDGNGLKNQSLTIYNYFNDNHEEDDNPVEIIQQMWKDTGNGSFNWVNSNLQTFSYDINNQVSMQVSSVV